MVGIIIPSIYLFIFLKYISFFFFLMSNTIYAVREHFVVLIFSKYLVLEFWLR